MRKENKILRATGLAAPLALTVALAAPALMAHEPAGENFWEAKGNQAWVNSSGECWQSKTGPSDLPPCVKIIESFTIDLVNDEFDFDKAILKPDMKVALDDLARRVKETSGDEHLTIVGHTDAKGSDAYNLGLGERRAIASKEYLVTVGGLDPSRIDVVSEGERNPVAPNTEPDGSDNPVGRAKNRRIEVRAELHQG